MSLPEQIKILSVVGARPNFMKVAPIIKAIGEHNEQRRSPRIVHVLVHTGQHYDAQMSDHFFEDLHLPNPDVHMGVGAGSHAKQTAEIMQKFEGVLLAERPQIVVVVGDVNSTLACALVTAKISFDSNGARPLIAHVESGLRSFDRGMPEEVNRVLTDHLSDLLFVTEESGLQNLQVEGVSPEKIHFVGNTMIDSLHAYIEKADTSTILEKLGLRQQPATGEKITSPDRYALLTLHRPSNVDNRETFLNILEGLEDLAMTCPIVFPVHPRTRQRIKEFGLEFPAGMEDVAATTERRGSAVKKVGVLLTDPLGYLDFLSLMKHAAIVVTDSGGIQEETTCLGVPCVTVRENTERPVTVHSGTNFVAGTRSENIKGAIRRQFGIKGRQAPRFWDGKAAKRIIDALIRIPSKEIPAQGPGVPVREG